jgi:hypothetical protein
VLAIALVVLVVEGYFVYRWYDRYYDYDYDYDAAMSGVASSAADPKTVEGTGLETEQDTENANSGENSSETTFSHTATDENSRGDYTYLSDPSINGNPNAVVLVTSSADRVSAGSATYDHNIGVWFEPRARRWAIFNQDRTAVLAGATFEVVVPRKSDGFTHRSELVNNVANSTYLDDPLTNGEPDAKVSVTQNWNPGGGNGVYNDRPIGVRYDEDVDKWAIYNRNGGPMPDGAAFNVAVSGSTEPAG